MPCREWFDAQDQAYRDSVIPPIVKARVSVEAAVSMGWRDVVGEHGRSVSLEHFGASADYATHLPRVRHHRGGRRPRRRGQPPFRREGHPLARPREGSTHMSERLQKLSDAGVSIWLDDLSRERIETGNLAELIKDKSVVGVTTNPTIFAGAISDGERYDDEVAPPRGRRRRRRQGRLRADHRATSAPPATSSSRSTRPPAGSTAGSRSRSPPTSRSTPTPPSRPRASCGPRSTATTCSSRSRPPPRARPAITDALGDGISVNVTLIFGLDRYQRRDGGVRRRAGEGARRPATTSRRIHSVASFFVSRVDTEIDKRLEAIGTDEALALRGKAGVANARLAYRAYEKFFSGDRWRRLADAGANTQRPLWASTGVKNPDYRDTMYVADLVVANTVNTMPEKTLEAFADHGEVDGDRSPTHYDDADKVMADLAAVGIDYDDVIAVLEKEGVDKFVDSWNELLDTVSGQMEAAKK